MTKTYTGGATPSVTYTYDGLRLSSVATSGRIATSTQSTGGVPYSFAYTYYKDGSLKSVTYPSGRLIEYPSLDRAGRVLKVQGTLAGTTTEYAKAVTYNASGQMSSLTFGNDLIERWDYNPRRLQPWQIRLGTATVDDARGRWQFGYCAGLNYNQDCATNNGNVMHQRILPLNIYQTYAYDTLNRLSLFEEKANSAAPACAPGGSTPCRAYGYDNWSNQFVSQANVVTRHSFTPAAASNFDAANRLIIQGSTYDPAGNQTAIGGYTFTYDAENRLKSSAIGGNTTTYAYDGEGRRVKKGNEIYVYDAFGNLAAEYGGTASSTGTRYLTTDHLGSTRLITKADGAVDQRIDYLPFGKAIPNGVSGRTTGQGYQTTNYLDPLKPGFTGKDRDGETGLDYFGARYMSAAQGRFTSADAPFADQNPADPQSWNLYLYVRNNPIIFVDPTGQRIELTGATEEERRKQLAAIQEAVGEEAGQRLTIHGDKKTGFYVGITGDLSKFRDINPVASAFATIITLQESAKFYLVSSMERMDMSDGTEYTLYALKATGATVRDIDGQLRVFVREPREGYPRDLPFGTSSWIGLANNLGTTVGHEFGHALEHMMGRLVGRRPTKVESNNGSLRLENMVRRLQGGPNAAIRLRH